MNPAKGMLKDFPKYLINNFKTKVNSASKQAE